MDPFMISTGALSGLVLGLAVPYTIFSNTRPVTHMLMQT